MKVTLLQQEGIVQLVLTPETKWEEKAISAIPDSDFKVFRGSFYEQCQGGWVREYSDDRSIIFVQNLTGNVEK